MKQSINFSQFCDAFRDCGRNDNFTYDGKEALYNFIEMMDEDTGTDTELDVIALCCEFSEYDNAIACVDEMGYEWIPSDGDAEEDDQEAEALEWLEDRTMVIAFNGGIIIQDF